MIDSLYQQEPSAQIVVLCLDEITQVLLKKIYNNSLELLSLSDIENQYPELNKAKLTRSLIEYYWTLTPVLMLYLLEQQNKNCGIIYIDSDQLFFSSTKPLMTALQDNPIILQPHYFPERLSHFIRNGRYNVGIVGARNNEIGIKVISWWGERCLEWCCDYVDTENQRYGDQKYLEFFSKISDDIGELQHHGIGVAPWNHENAEFSYDQQGKIFFGDAPLVVYHYHSLVIMGNDIIIPSKHKHYRLTAEVVEFCYLPYAEALEKAEILVRRFFPRFAHSTINDDMDDAVPLLVRRASKAEDLCRALPYVSHDFGGHFIYYEPSTELSQNNGNIANQ